MRLSHHKCRIERARFGGIHLVECLRNALVAVCLQVKLNRPCIQFAAGQTLFVGEILRFLEQCVWDRDCRFHTVSITIVILFVKNMYTVCNV